MVHLLVNTCSHLLLLAVLQVPKECPEVPSKMLNPEEQWANKAEFKDMRSCTLTTSTSGCLIGRLSAEPGLMLNSMLLPCCSF